MEDQFPIIKGRLIDIENGNYVRYLDEHGTEHLSKLYDAPDYIQEVVRIVKLEG